MNEKNKNEEQPTTNELLLWVAYDDNELAALPVLQQKSELLISWEERNSDEGEKATSRMAGILWENKCWQMDGAVSIRRWRAEEEKERKVG